MVSRQPSDWFAEELDAAFEPAIDDGGDDPDQADDLAQDVGLHDDVIQHINGHNCRVLEDLGGSDAVTLDCLILGGAPHPLVLDATQGGYSWEPGDIEVKVTATFDSITILGTPNYHEEIRSQFGETLPDVLVDFA